MSAILLLPPAAFLAALAATGWVRAWLGRRALLDHPNERSSHSVPTPRGGGLAVVPVVAAAWALAGLWAPEGIGAQGLRLGLVLGAALVLAGLSFIDDLWPLPVMPRLLVQAAAVAAGVAALPAGHPVFQGLLPLPLDRLAAGLLWLWFVNLFNFMDGIDGISGVECIAVGGGASLVAILLGQAAPAIPQGLTLAAAAAGFLAWNWPPARIFLGDVGSVTLGFLSGWLLLTLAAAGAWPAALLLPLYYLADASLTLARRAWRRERIWQAHRQHFYQQGARRLNSHGKVTLRLALLDAALIALAACATRHPAAGGAALAAGAVLTALMLAHFAAPGERPSHAG